MGAAKKEASQVAKVLGVEVPSECPQRRAFRLSKGVRSQVNPSGLQYYGGDYSVPSYFSPEGLELSSRLTPKPRSRSRGKAYVYQTRRGHGVPPRPNPLLLVWPLTEIGTCLAAPPQPISFLLQIIWRSALHDPMRGIRTYGVSV